MDDSPPAVVTAQHTGPDAFVRRSRSRRTVCTTLVFEVRGPRADHPAPDHRYMFLDRSGRGFNHRNPVLPGKADEYSPPPGLHGQPRGSGILSIGRCRLSQEHQVLNRRRIDHLEQALSRRFFAPGAREEYVLVHNLLTELAGRRRLPGTSTWSRVLGGVGTRINALVQ